MALHIHGTEFHIPGDAYFKTTISRLIKGFSGFGRDANILVALSLIGSVGGALFGLAMPLYLQALGYSFSDIGLLMALGTLTVVFVLIPSGIAADRFGRKGIMLLGSTLGTISVFLFFLTNNFYVFAAANVLGGLSNALSGPALNALFSEKSSERRRKYLFSLNAFAGTIGNALGMLFGGILPNIHAYTKTYDITFWFQMMFLLSFLISLAKTLGFLFVKEKKLGRKAKTKLIPASWNVIKLFALTSCLIGFGAGLVIPWFQIYFRTKFGAAYSDIGYVFSLQQFIMALSILFMPKLAERTGSVKAIVLTQGLAIVVLVLIPNSPLFAIAAVAFIIRAVLMNVATPIQGAFMMSVVNEEDRASATAINALCWTGSWSLGTIASGYVMEWNIDAPFFITAVFYTIYILSFYLFFRKMGEKYTGHSIPLEN